MLDLVPEGRADVNSLGFARAFDDPGFRGVGGRGGAASATRSGSRSPPCWGSPTPHAAWADMQERLARPVFEVPTLPPSVPGMRVFATLRDALRRAGGKVILNAVVVGAERDGARVTGVRARIGLREQAYGADHVVLATRRLRRRRARARLVLAGARGRARAAGEPACPDAGEERFVPAYFDEQPMARAGIAVDRDLRPAGRRERRRSWARRSRAPRRGARSPATGSRCRTGHRAAELILGARAARSRRRRRDRRRTTSSAS